MSLYVSHPRHLPQGSTPSIPTQVSLPRYPTHPGRYPLEVSPPEYPLPAPPHRGSASSGPTQVGVLTPGTSPQDELPCSPGRSGHLRASSQEDGSGGRSRLSPTRLPTTDGPGEGPACVFVMMSLVFAKRSVLLCSSSPRKAAPLLLCGPSPSRVLNVGLLSRVTPEYLQYTGVCFPPWR